MTGKHAAWKPEEVAAVRSHLVRNKFRLGGYPTYVGLVGTLNRLAKLAPAPKDDRDGLTGREERLRMVGLRPKPRRVKTPADPHPDWENRIGQAWEDGDTGEIVDDSGTPVEFAPRSAVSHANRTVR